MRVSRFTMVLGLGAAVVAGCSPGTGVPGQFELTKPRMDREREVGPATPAKGEIKETDTVHGGLPRDARAKTRHGDDQPEHP
jgi:hypothetical protein